MGQRGYLYKLQQAKGENAKMPYIYIITNYAKNYAKIMSKILTLHKKICVILNNASNKSCWALNWTQKSQWAHTSVFPLKWNKGVQKIDMVDIYYNVQKQKITFL